MATPRLPTITTRMVGSEMLTKLACLWVLSLFQMIGSDSMGVNTRSLNPMVFQPLCFSFFFWGKGLLGASVVNGWLVGRVRENWPWWVTAEAGYRVIKSPRKMQFRRYRKMLEKHLQRRTWKVTLKSKYKYPVLLGPARQWTLQKSWGTQGTGMATAWSS